MFFSLRSRLCVKMEKHITSRSLARKKKRGNKSDLHCNRAEVLSMENFPPGSVRDISHASLDRPQDIRFLIRAVRGAVDNEETTKERKHDEPIAKV